MHQGTKKAIATCLVAGALAAAGCLDRPVDNRAPTLVTNVSLGITSKVIDKIDVLFDIDNSASMGDKQDYLKAAIPDLVNRLVNPTCVDAMSAPQSPSVDGVCPSGQKPEFAPVHDLHLGIISSSLGKRGGDECDPATPAQAPYQNVLAHDDDGAHLLNRTLTYADGGVSESPLPDAPAGDPYLYWFPASSDAGAMPGPGAPVSDAGTLVTDFADLVHGTGVFGCGIESQLESWYRFLVQPDPYASITVSNGVASWSGLDSTIIQERHDFLRPDSLVLVVVLSDENDSEIDVRSLGGQAYHWMESAFPVPRGTSGCSDPASPACQSCAQGSNGTTDPTCVATPAYTSASPNDWGFDINLRHVHMKAKYGVDPQYPIARYVTGLTSLVVPDRSGEYPSGAGSYVGTTDCQNPLFAASLPDANHTDVNSLCHAPPGARTKDLVFYAHIGGVPSQLLHFDPTDPKASTLTSADWTKILGKDPENYDYTGIDPHMIESYAPRAALSPPSSPNDADPVNGREWITNQGAGHVLAVDREYACTFPLVDSTGKQSSRDCTLAENRSFCDCPRTSGSVTSEELPPICDPATQTLQTGAKAYPTIRELLLAKYMGTQGIVSSICPIHVADDDAGSDPYYGYRPAVAVIVERLKSALDDECLPQRLQGDSTGGVQCLVLLQVPNGQAGTGGTCLDPTCPSAGGLAVPDPDVLGKYCQGLEDSYDQQVAASGTAQGLTDPAKVPVCALQQLTSSQFPNDFPNGSCATETNDRGWCYVTGSAAGDCPQAIYFSPGALPSGSNAQLQCAEQSVAVLGDGGTAE
jgi:hypothetical protein